MQWGVRALCGDLVGSLACSSPVLEERDEDEVDRQVAQRLRDNVREIDAA